MVVSGGAYVLKRADIVYWRGNTSTLDGRALDIIGASTSYSTLYRRQLWVSAAVNKIANATARLPLKVYARNSDGRDDARDTPYGELIRKPSKTMDSFTFWVWVRSTLDIYGEAMLGKVRDAGGRPVELKPLNPLHMGYDVENRRWSYDDGRNRIEDFPRRDFVHFRHFNPESVRGMSPLESLRATLENEEGARRANSALWRNGGRPSVTLQHPGRLSDEAQKRLALSWADVHGGVDNWAKAAVLEEGMTVNVLPLNVEELQYIEARKLNREEVCAGFDIPPPVLHILDHATYSNITEQMRSMYRDTMGPKLGHLEATLDMELRDGSMGTNNEPDFPDDLYAEFLMDEVLRGDFEVRAQAYSSAINSGWMQPAEVRSKENLPFVEGSDKLLINSTLVPVGGDTGGMSTQELSLSLQKIYLAADGPIISADEAREILNRGGANLTGPAPEPEPTAAPKSLAPDTVRTLMGRMSRAKTVGDIDRDNFTTGITGAVTVLRALDEALAVGESLEVFKHRIKTLTLPDTEPPAVHLHLKSPDVYVTSPEIHNHVAAPEVHNHVAAPEPSEPPVIHNHVHTPPPVPMRREVERSDDGRITATVDTPL